MEFFDYDNLDDEYDRILKEASPCEDCGSKDYQAIAMITELELHGTIILFCSKCDTIKEDTDNSIDKEDEFKVICA